MKALRSFRSRLLVGSVLWSLGLLFVVHALSLLLMRRGSRVFHISPLGLALAFVVMAAGISQVRVGLSPLRNLRSRLASVRDGRERRIEGTYPTEVEPLVGELNALLDHREEAVRRALAKAGDLAHGLKTPLAILAREADEAEAAGDAGRAAAIRQQVDRMRRQIDYHLAHARAAGSGAAPGARCSVGVSAEGLARTLRRLYAERNLAIMVDVSGDPTFRGEIEDLDEMIGNLFDNACKWANRDVAIRAAAVDGRVVITVDDDGPGVPEDLRHRVLLRGVRADELAPGSGIGLAIVRDLAELYGGSICLDASPAGGLRARLELPG